MNIPNIYEKGNYILLAFLPLSLIILSLVSIFFLHPLKLGIDFTGGIEVQIITKDKPNLKLLLNELEKENYSIFFSSLEQNPTGYLTYLEISRSPILIKAEELKSEFFTLAQKVTSLEVALLSNSQNQTLLEEHKKEREKIDKIANSIFDFTLREKNASSYQSISALSKEVQNSFAVLYSKENNKLREILSKNEKNSSISLKERTSTLSKDFISRANEVSIVSIILIIIAVFLIFRTAVPSLAVIAGAIADIIFALGFMSWLAIPLNLATFATLLMLIGFSLDTDILLTMNLLKRRDEPLRKRAYDAMKTGMTMSLSTIVAFITLLIVAFITKIQLYYIIAIVAIGGLIGDLIATWAFNAVILLYYIEQEEKKGRTVQTKNFWDILFRN